MAACLTGQRYRQRLTVKNNLGDASMGTDDRAFGTVPRRTVLSMMSAGLASAVLGTGGRALSADGGDGAILATPQQIEAEKTLLRLLKEPKLRALQSTLRTKWAATPRGQTRDGAARLDEAIAQWTNSLIFAELAEHQSGATFLWGTDDTPRSWLGHTIGGVGTSGDNPDAVYRTAIIDGDSQYEIAGKFDMARKPTQLTMEVDTTRLTRMPKIDYSKNSDLVSSVSQLTDRDLVTDADGSFRITVGGQGQGQGPNHLATSSGTLTLGTRDIIPDWDRQRPSRLTIRQTGGKPFEPATYAVIAQHLYEDLAGYLEFWAPFPDTWFGGLHGSHIAEPKGRNGGWGFVNGLSFDFAAPDDAIVVTLDPAGAAYTGIQIIDPWMIAPDAKKYQVCLSSAQALANPDGTRTYVISMTDPGVANWLDTAGLHQGLAIMRWQAVSKTTTKDTLVREFRVLKHADLAAFKDLARVTPAQRAAAVAARAKGYANRAT
jgi:hypothetical protein